MRDPEQTRKRLIASNLVLNEMAGLTAMSAGEVLNNSVDSCLKSFMDTSRIVAEVRVTARTALDTNMKQLFISLHGV